MGFTSRTFGPCLSLWANQGGYMTPVIILWMIATAATSQNWTKTKTPDSMSCVQLEMWLDIFSWIFVIPSIYYKLENIKSCRKLKMGILRWAGNVQYNDEVLPTSSLLWTWELKVQTEKGSVELEVSNEMRNISGDTICPYSLQNQLGEGKTSVLKHPQPCSHFV
jgi:hypothetical protein